MTSDAVQSTSRMLNDKTTLSRIIKTNSSVIPKKSKMSLPTFNKTHDQYLMYVYEQQNSTDELVSFPNQIKDLYINYEELSAVYIVLNQLPEYYESSRENKGGEVKAGTPKLLERLLSSCLSHKRGAESGGIFLSVSKRKS